MRSEVRAAWRTDRSREAVGGKRHLSQVRQSCQDVDGLPHVPDVVGVQIEVPAVPSMMQHRDG